MYDDIRKNKIKTGVIVSIFLAMISVIVYSVCYMFDMGEMSVVIAVAVSIISTIATYYNCDKIVLASVNARHATREEDLQLTNILDALMVTADLPVKPELYVIDSMQPNAFATGRDPEHSIICVTKGLIEKMNYYELEGVIAHEMSHIKNYDIRLNAVISVMVGTVVTLSDFVLRAGMRSSRRSSSDNNSSSGISAIIFLIGLVCLILSPIISKLIQLAVSRRREYLADATAVSLTRNPDGLISALQKLGSDKTELETASNGNAHMYIVNPFTDKRDKTNLFSTHPTIEQRVEALKNLQ